MLIKGQWIVRAQIERRYLFVNHITNSIVTFTCKIVKTGSMILFTPSPFPLHTCEFYLYAVNVICNSSLLGDVSWILFWQFYMWMHVYLIVELEQTLTERYFHSISVLILHNRITWAICEMVRLMEYICLCGRNGEIEDSGFRLANLTFKTDRLE